MRKGVEEDRFKNFLVCRREDALQDAKECRDLRGAVDDICSSGTCREGKVSGGDVGAGFDEIPDFQDFKEASAEPGSDAVILILEDRL